ncbi:type II toxin-antitoxin system VapC family toxin [Sphingomonas sp. RS2018]
MKAVDTNILVRWITRDDPVQTPIADQVMAEAVYVSLGVLLELAWTLGGRPYRFDREAVVAALQLMLATRTVTVAQEDGVLWAIERFAAGADIADMLHIVAGRGSDAFVSFERRLAKLAGPDSPLTVEQAI